MRTDRAFLDDQLNFSADRGITDAMTRGTKEPAINTEIGEKIILLISFICLERILADNNV